MYCMKIPAQYNISVLQSLFTSITRIHNMYVLRSVSPSYTRIYRIFPAPVYRVQLCHPYSSHVNFNHFRIFFVCVAFWIFFPNSSPRKPPRSLIRGTYYYISVLLRFFILFILFLSSKMCVCYMLNMVILSPSPLSSSVCGVSRGKLGREDMSRINKSGTFFPASTL